jgi:hypothetical protein
VAAGAVVVVGGDVVGLLTALAAVVGGEGPALGALALALASAGDGTVVVVARRSPTGLPMASTSGRRSSTGVLTIVLVVEPGCVVVDAVRR